MSETAGVVTAEGGGWTITTNSGSTEEQVREILKPEADKSASKAASELGKRGASAKARTVETDEEPKEAEPEVEKTAAEADKSAPDEDEAEEKAPEKKPNPRHDPKARMLEATRKEAEAKRALAEERSRREAIEARLAEIERRVAPKEPERQEAPRWTGETKPSPGDFETYEEYLDARDTYNRKTWEKETLEKSQAEGIYRALREQKSKFEQAAASDLDKYSEEVLSLQTEFQLPEGTKPSARNWIANELFFSPESARPLMLHFSEHPEDLQRIAALQTPRAVSREMAKLEARLEAAMTGAPSPEREVAVSRAAPPVKPVAGKPYVTESAEWKPGMTLDDYARVWNKARLR